MGESLPPLSEAELGIMNAVWDRGEATVADVWGSLREARGVARNTILTQMDRLVEKGWLLRDSGGHAFRYRATVPREATLSSLVSRLVDAAFGGSAEGLVLALLHGRGVSGQEAERIRAMIDEAGEGRLP
jgi:BlaI family penicillinase repressor